ncbi:nonstructural polyprotein [Weevil wasp positive-strand RNA virus 1]|nr:nonstructural polyprotein [Weevil wasp positive-strand RNA virus 1]
MVTILQDSVELYVRREQRQNISKYIEISLEMHKKDKTGRPFYRVPEQLSGTTTSGDHSYSGQYFFGGPRPGTNPPPNQSWMYGDPTPSSIERGDYSTVRSSYTGSLPCHKSLLPSFGNSSVNQPNWPEKSQNLERVIHDVKNRKWTTQMGVSQTLSKITTEVGCQTEEHLLNDYLSRYLDQAIDAYEQEKMKIKHSSKDYLELKEVVKTNGIHQKHIGNLAPTPIEPKIKVVKAPPEPPKPKASRRSIKNAMQKRNFPPFNKTDKPSITSEKACKGELVMGYPSMGVVYTPYGVEQLPKLLTPFKQEGKSYAKAVGDSKIGKKTTTYVEQTPTRPTVEKKKPLPRSVKSFLQENYTGRKAWLQEHNRKEMSLYWLLRESAPKSWSNYEEMVEAWNPDLFYANNFWEVDNRLTAGWLLSNRRFHRTDSEKWKERPEGTKIISHGPVEPDFSRIFETTSQAHKMHVKENISLEDCKIKQSKNLFEIEEPEEPVSPVFWTTQSGPQEKFSTEVEESIFDGWNMSFILKAFFLCVCLIIITACMNSMFHNFSVASSSFAPLLFIFMMIYFKMTSIMCKVKGFIKTHILSTITGVIPTEEQLYDSFLKKEELRKSNEISIPAMVTEISNRPLGVASQLYQLSKAKDKVELTAATVGMLSMIGLEEKIIGKSVGFLSKKIYDTNRIKTQSWTTQESMSREKLIGLSSCALELSRSVMEGRLPEPRILNQNRKAVEELTVAFEPLLVECGIMSPEETVLTQIQDKSVSLVKRFDDFSIKLATDLSDFVIGEQAVLWRSFVRDAKNFHEIIGRNTDPKIRSSSAFQDFTKIWMLITEYEQKIAVAAKMCGTRPAPVGVCLVGDSNIGKSKSFPIIQHKVNQILELQARLFPELRQVLGYPEQWGTWYQNSREEFDQGHKAGDKWVYTDDGFASIDNLDHEKYLAFISTNPIGTKQASIAEKGSPFEAACMVTSCNRLPVESFTINNISALWNRFPFTIGVRLKPGHKVPPPTAPLDPEFKHLEFHVGPMSTHCFKGDRNNCEWRKGSNAKTNCPCRDMSLDEICIAIAEQIVAFHRKYLSEKDYLKKQGFSSFVEGIPHVLERSLDDMQEIFYEKKIVAPFSKILRDEDFTALGGKWQSGHVNFLKRIIFRRPKQREHYFVKPFTSDMRDSYIYRIAGIKKKYSVSSQEDSPRSNAYDALTEFIERKRSDAIKTMDDRRLCPLLDYLYSVPTGIPLRLYLENLGIEDPLKIFLFAQAFAPNRGCPIYWRFLKKTMEEPLIFEDSSGEIYIWSYSFHEGSMVIPARSAHTVNWAGYTNLDRNIMFYHTMDLPECVTDRKWAYTITGSGIFMGWSPYFIDSSLAMYYMSSGFSQYTGSLACRYCMVNARAIWDESQSLLRCSKDIVKYAWRTVYGASSYLFEVYRNLAVKIGNGIYWIAAKICRFFGIEISLQDLWTKIKPFVFGAAGTAVLASLIWVAFGCFLSKVASIWFNPTQTEGAYTGQPVKETSRSIVKGAKAKKQIVKCGRPVVTSFVRKQNSSCLLCRAKPLHKIQDYLILEHPGNTRAYLICPAEHRQENSLDNIDDFGKDLHALSYLFDRVEPTTGFFWAQQEYEEDGTPCHPYIGFSVADAKFVQWDEDEYSIEIQETIYGKRYQIEMAMGLDEDSIDEFLNWYEDNVPTIEHKNWKLNGYISDKRLVGTLTISITTTQKSQEGLPSRQIEHVIQCPRCREENQHFCEDKEKCKIICVNKLCQDQVSQTEQIKTKAKSVKQQADEAAEQLLHSLQKNILVTCYWGCSELGERKVDWNQWADSNRGTTKGLGYQNTIISVAHGTKVGDYFPVKFSGEIMTEFVCVAKVIKVDRPGDKSYSVLISKTQALELFESVPKNYLVKQFSSLLDTHTMEKEDLLKMLSSYNRVAFKPRDIIFIGTATYVGASSRIIDDKIQDSKSFDVSNFNTRDVVSRPGDCGNPYVFYNTKIQHKLCGIHNSASSNMTGVSLISQEEVKILDNIAQGWKTQFCKLSSVTEKWDRDPWKKYLVEPSKGSHVKNIPHGPEFTYLGGLSYPNCYGPLNEKRDWEHSPFWGAFEVRKIPSAMNSYDQRIKTEVPTNRIGEPSLGYAQLEQLCCEIPKGDSGILEECFIQYRDYAINLLQGKPLGIKGFSIDQIIELGLNGITSSDMIPPIELNKSAGVPWTEKSDTRKKSTLIDCTPEGKRTITNSELYARLVFKHENAMRNNRVLGFWASKLKDELVKPSKVEKGVNRIFQSSPVEYVIYVKGLFNNFIRFFREKRDEFSHAMAIDPISGEWQDHSQFLAFFENRVGIDYKNYDKRTSEYMSYLVYRLMIETIEAVDPDEFTQARWVAAHEGIYTYLAEEETVIRANRGNKSGDPLTTEKNCIGNFLYHFYSFSKELGRVDLDLFMTHTRRKFLGDDADVSVSPEAIELMNFPTLQKNIAELGQIVTLPGDFKDVETTEKFLPMEQVTFLKRYYKNENGVWYAPLERTSIEAPFSWSKNKSWELDIWRELVRASLQEAALHGDDYFNYFSGKIRTRMAKSYFPEDLRMELSALMTKTYEDFLFQVDVKYGKYSC